MISKCEEPTQFTMMGSKRPSQLSIASNLASLYEKCNIHIKIVKCTGVIARPACFNVYKLSVTSNIERITHKKQSGCIKIVPLEEENSNRK
jgi:hypothetical protein